MPGYNVFGDGLFFGEAMLKEKMVEVSPPCPLTPFSPFSPFSPLPGVVEQRRKCGGD